MTFLFGSSDFRRSTLGMADLRVRLDVKVVFSRHGAYVVKKQFSTSYLK